MTEEGYASSSTSIPPPPPEHDNDKAATAAQTAAATTDESRVVLAIRTSWKEINAIIMNPLRADVKRFPAARLCRIIEV
jgi:hypothetical protein